MLQADDYKMKQIVIDAARCNSRTTTATRSSSSSVAAAAVACRLSVYLWLARGICGGEQLVWMASSE